MGDSTHSDIRQDDDVAPAVVAKQSFDWKHLFDRLPVILILAGWLAYAASYSGQASYLWALGFSPEQAALSPGAALIRTTPGAIVAVFILGIMFFASYGLVRFIAFAEGFRSRPIKTTWKIVAIAIIFLALPFVPYFIVSDQTPTSLKTLSGMAFGFFWAVGLLALAILANRADRRLVAVGLALTACAFGAFQLVENGDHAGTVVRQSCQDSVRSILVGFRPQYVQVTWAKAADAPMSLRTAPPEMSDGIRKRPDAAPGALAADMLLIVDSGQQFLLYSCAAKTSYTVEHGTVSIERPFGTP